MPTTTFIISTLGRSTLDRTIKSVGPHPYLVEYDRARIGEATIRNRLIKKAKTPWVSMLDDDDTVTSDYVERLEEEIYLHPEADVIFFREYFLHGVVIPLSPEVIWGNIGISFSVKKKWAVKYPFQQQRHEDLEFIRRLEAAGAKIHFSKYLTYHARH